MRRRHARDEPEDPHQPKKSKVQRLKEVLPLAWTVVRPRLPALGLGLLLILISRSAGLVLPATARVFIDEVVTGVKPEKMRLVFIAVVAAALVQAVCSYFLFRVLTVRTIDSWPTCAPAASPT
jgi:subfamily B ATP-binding cassette protein MsbA